MTASESSPPPTAQSPTSQPPTFQSPTAPPSAAPPSGPAGNGSAAVYPKVALTGPPPGESGPPAEPGRATVPAHPSFPELEERVLAYWAADGTFQASVEQRDPVTDGEYVFYDGPPFANGLPHYGHLLTGYAKDAVPRFRSMLGQRVERRFGWDCHGLPAEVTAEKQLGINTKSEIEQLGIARFNEACRSSVLRYTGEWQDYVTRQARWADFDNDYKTLDTDYMESVMWAFRSLWDKGLIYDGFRVLWYCWRCETPLSNTETRMDDVYRTRQDPAVTVGLELETGEHALVWTTTPWTLPSNLAAAVHPELAYVTVAPVEGPFAGREVLLAEERLEAYAEQLGADIAERVVRRRSGTELLGLSYTPPYPFFVGRENAHRVLAADYVTTEEGTGMVHIAPAFGEEDKVVTDAAGIEVVVPVDARGRFTAEVPPYAGLQVFDANRQIIRDLREQGSLLADQSHEHSYPHCWRCDNALIQRAVTSWFVAVSTITERMVELNQQIDWVPAHIRDGQFGKWLEGARDWSISRNRYWGSPIPVWVSDDPNHPRTDVYGSLDELEADFGVRPHDLHRPAIDELTRPNPDDPSGSATMRRVPEVLDCWFESGSMPFAQVHYPFENAEWFEQHYPGDFIVEYNGQTRGWFYTLHVLATALFDRPAFRTCLAHGIVLGDDGQKMSKSKRNYPDVREVFDTEGSDAMRWFLLSSTVLRGGNLVVSSQGIREGVRASVLPLWNSYYFLSLYAGAAGRSGRWRTDSEHQLDRYVLADTRQMVAGVRAAMLGSDLTGAATTVREFLEGLTNWYVRRSRERFWVGETDAIDTLHTVLEITCRAAAPLLPLTTEAIWRGLTGGRSVHLCDFPAEEQLPADSELVSAMDRARQVCSAALSLRKARGLRVRQPLRSLTVAASDAPRLEQLRGIIADEVNVKTVELTTDVANYGRFELTVNARACGPRLGPDVQRVIRAVKAGEWSTSDGVVTAAGIELLDGEYAERLVAADPNATVELPAGSGLVVLDLEVDAELAADGLARDVVRLVQQARRDADLNVSDRVRVSLDLPEDVASAVGEYEDFLANETLAIEVHYRAVTTNADAAGVIEGTIADGHVVRVAVERA